jgi:hypothetical protein
MPDDIAPVGTPAPAAAPVIAPAAATAPAVVAPLATVAPVVQPAVPGNTEDPAWLPQRLERATSAARAAVLAELGVKDAGEAKAAVEAAKAAAEAKKTAETRAAELAAELNTTRTVAERQQGLFKELAGRMLGALAPDQLKAVQDFAGDDPEKQYAAIKHFGPTWAAAEQAKEAAARAVAEVAAAKAPPASTSAAPAAPSSETPTTSTQDPSSVYQTTRSKNPFAAAAYGLSNPTVYDSKA